MDRLKSLIDSRKVTPYQICKDTGVSEAALSRILSGKTKKVSNKTAEALANYFGVDKLWLMNGEHTSSMDSVITNNSGVVVNGQNTVGDIDNRHYTSDSPDVLRQDIARLETIIAEKEDRIKEKDAQIKEKDAQIKEKDAQIKEKDAQINKLLDILKAK